MIVLRAAMVAAGVPEALVYKKFISNDTCLVTPIQSRTIMDGDCRTEVIGPAAGGHRSLEPVERVEVCSAGRADPAVGPNYVAAAGASVMRQMLCAGRSTLGASRVARRVRQGDATRGDVALVLAGRDPNRRVRRSPRLAAQHSSMSSLIGPFLSFRSRPTNFIDCHPGAPFADKKSLPLYYDFEKAVYQSL